MSLNGPAGSVSAAVTPAADQLQRLRDEPQLTGSAIHELLRFDAAVQLDVRIARDFVLIGGNHVCKGKRVIIRRLP